MDGGPPPSAEDQRADAPGPERRRRWPWWLVALLAGAVLAATGAGLFVATQFDRPDDANPFVVLAAAASLIAGGLLFVAGLGYYVLAPPYQGREAAWRDVGSHRLVLASTLLVVILANVTPAIWLLARPSQGLCSVPGFIAAALSVDVVLLGVTYLRFVRPGILTRANLGLDADRLPRHVTLGLIVGFCVLTASALVQLALRAAGVQQTQLVDLQCIRAFPLAGFLVVLFIGGLLAPIAEELFFRGYVFRTYRERRGPVVAYGATSLLFAMLHLNLPALLPILLMSAIFCWAYWRTRSIVPSIVGHALNNSTAFCILYFSNAPPQ